MRGGTTTRVDKIIRVLLESLPARMPQGVVVVDGDAPISPPDDALIVGMADPDTPGIVVLYATTTNRQPVEQVEISLIARSYSGDADMNPRRARCAEIIAGVQQFIRDNARHDDAWDQLELGPSAFWHPVYTEKGSNCYVAFSLIATGAL